MTSVQTEVVEDPKGLLNEDDHMRDMERLRMEIVAIRQPFDSVMRVTGRIEPVDPVTWTLPNVAVRIEVESPVGQRPVSRVYTIRRYDSALGEVEIDFVLHDDDSPAMRWLHAVQPGDEVWMTGPRPHFVPDHASGKRAAILADETAIPAVFAILEAWPADATGTVWIETGNLAAVDELPEVEGVKVHILQRARDEAAGTTGRLFAAARSAVADVSGWTVWAAGERQEMRDLRNHFRAAGMARDDLKVLGYWKKGTSSSELDRMRLAEYARMRESGLSMDDMRDADIAV
jgi:NADPH-dependent ferric siderophore reductase